MIERIRKRLSKECVNSVIKQPVNRLFYGDNLDVLRRKIKDETVDLCYIDPPFNSKRSYNQIYNRVGTEDRAQAQAFTDTWVWDDYAAAGYEEIITNAKGVFPVPLVELMKGLCAVLGKGSLLAYLVHMSLRVTEIHRVLKPTGSFYLHCDPTASHYLKLILDAVFCSQGGEYLNEIVWCYNQGGKSKKWFGRKHDTIFWYVKGNDYQFNGDAVCMPLTPHKQDKTGRNYGGRMGIDEDGREYVEKWGTGNKKLYRYYLDKGKVPEDWWIDINSIQADANERLGYPTQKPEALLERIIKASSNEGDVVLDAYCGCGTTVAVAQRLNRKWIGIDITYQSISLVLKRLEERLDKSVLDTIITDGVPRDMESAVALANKKDDRLRKEFEKWAVLTYTNNRARINEKKGADGGIDARSFFATGKETSDKIVYQVKSGKVGRKDIATLHSDMKREKAAMGIFITLEPPTKPMLDEAKEAGKYHHVILDRSYDKIKIVMIKDIVENGERLDVMFNLEAVKTAEKIQKPRSRGLFNKD